MGNEKLTKVVQEVTTIVKRDINTLYTTLCKWNLQKLYNKIVTMLSSVTRESDTSISGDILDLETENHTKLYSIKDVRESVQELCSILGCRPKIIKDYIIENYKLWENTDQEEELEDPYYEINLTLRNTLKEYALSLSGNQDYQEE